MLKTSKKCITCGIEKSLDKYRKRKESKDGYDYSCKYCQNEKTKLYQKTKKGLLAAIYAHQRGHSKDRGHPMPNYTLQDLRDRYINDEKFIYLYNNWVANGYKRDDVPSLDRKNDNLPYTLDNLRIVRFRINYKKANRDAKSGKLKKTRHCKKVYQHTLEGKLLKDFVSASQAARELGLSQGHISTNCRGEIKSASGYIFSFTKL